MREEEYAQDRQIGSYMYFFKHRGVNYCVDATDESPYKGRLINHSVLRPNLKTKVSAFFIWLAKNMACKNFIKTSLVNLVKKLQFQVVDFGTSFHLVLIAKRDIDVGEELLYDYGDRTPCTVSENPWLLNSWLIHQWFPFLVINVSYMLTLWFFLVGLCEL